jgi:hypothetical protein
MHLAPTTHHRLPSAADALAGPAEALHLITIAMRRPRRDETIVLLLDHRRCGLGLVVVAGTSAPDDVVAVVERLVEPAVHGGRVGSMVVGTIRASPAARPTRPDSDVDRWLEMSDLAERAGVELVEWFVLADDVSCPRDLLGEAPRW